MRSYQRTASAAAPNGVELRPKGLTHLGPERLAGCSLEQTARAAILVVGRVDDGTDA